MVYHHPLVIWPSQERPAYSEKTGHNGVYCLFFVETESHQLEKLFAGNAPNSGLVGKFCFCRSSVEFGQGRNLRLIHNERVTGHVTFRRRTTSESHPENLMGLVLSH